MSNTPWKPWHKVVTLKEDVRSGELSLSQFAADLYDVAMDRGPSLYRVPAEFFGLTLATVPLRDLARDVVLRLAGKSDKAVRQLELTYGGGKTHAEIALYHLVNDPDHLPKVASVDEFLTHIGQQPPKARVAMLPFDKLDVEKGMEVKAPDGTTRWLKRPWSVLAYQLAGADGLRLLSADGGEGERDSAPAENLLSDLFTVPEAEGLATLILIDEVLMFAREKVGFDPSWGSRLVNFFQYLTQAATKVRTCAVVASLLATDPTRSDELGRRLQADLYDIFHRQREEAVEPVGKEDVAEILRRRFFTPDSIGDSQSFRPHVIEAIKGIAELDEQTARARQAAEARFVSSYPFHPDLTEVLYSKWTQLEGFQRTRGVLRTFALALRDAEAWDEGPLAGVNVFLSGPGSPPLSEAARELTTVARYEETEGPRQEWVTIVAGELERARRIQEERGALGHRELEQVVFATFLHSQPVGQKAHLRDLLTLVGPTRPDRIELGKALQEWADISWFLDEAGVGETGTEGGGQRELPTTWRLGSRPNLSHMHADAVDHVDAPRVDFIVDRDIGARKELTRGAVVAGARVHTLPERPRDVEDDGLFHFVILGTRAASDSGKPSSEARRFIEEHTGPGKPRVFRNAIVIAVPSREGVEMVRHRVTQYIAWEDVEASLKDQEVDPFRRELLSARKEADKKRIPEAIDQAYSTVVTVNESNEIVAFKVTVGGQPLFATIKSDPRARIQETAISADALLPEGPYDLWQNGETTRRAKDLITAFAQFPHLPKMLDRTAITSTIASGCRDGLLVLRLHRPDNSVRTFWREAPDEMVLSDPGLEIVLPEAAELVELPPALLASGQLPGLWPDPIRTVAQIKSYFAGGTVVQIEREGYTEPITVPRVAPDAVEAAIAEATETGHLWLQGGPASVLQEPVPPGVLNDSSTVQAPPLPIPPTDLIPEALPTAWSADETTALSIASALSARAGQNLPWITVRTTVDAALRMRVLERAVDSGPWPVDLPGAGAVKLRVPEGVPASHIVTVQSGVLRAEAVLDASQVQDLADVVADLVKAAAGCDLRFVVQIEVGGDEPPPDPAMQLINALLAEVRDDFGPLS